MIKIIVNFQITRFSVDKYVDKSLSIILTFNNKEEVTNEYINEVLKNNHPNGMIIITNMQLIP
jgi:hypothetical protein